MFEKILLPMTVRMARPRHSLPLLHSLAALRASSI